MVGYLQYREIVEELDKKWIIATAVFGSLFVMVMIVAVLLLLNYKKKSKKMRNYRRRVEEQELEIKQSFREGSVNMFSYLQRRYIVVDNIHLLTVESFDII